MAIRYTCDGCDADLPAKPDIDRQTVTIELRGLGAQLFSAVCHLCDRCIQHLPDKADPRQWPRSAPAAQECMALKLARDARAAVERTIVTVDRAETVLAGLLGEAVRT